MPVTVPYLTRDTPSRSSRVSRVLALLRNESHRVTVRVFGA